MDTLATPTQFKFRLHSSNHFRYVLNSAFSDGCGKTSLLSLQETAYPSLLPDIALAPDIISSNNNTRVEECVDK